MLDYELWHELRQQKDVLKKVANTLQDFPISGSYKALFMGLVSNRGIRDIAPYKQQVISIASLDCDIIALLLKDKSCGIETIYKISQVDDVGKRAEIYTAIKNSGIRNIDILKLIMTPRLKTLFD